MITDGSVASLGSVSLLGEAAVDITARARARRSGMGLRAIRSGGRVAGRRRHPGRRRHRKPPTCCGTSGRAVGRSGTLVTDESVYRDLNGLSIAAEDVAKNLNQGRGTLGRLMTDPRAARSLETSMDNLADVTGRIRAGEGSLGRCSLTTSLARSLTSATTNLDSITGRVNRGEGTLGQLATEPRAVRPAQFDGRVDAVTADLQQGRGDRGTAAAGQAVV